MPTADLVLLTSSFPFGSVAEPFLETELPIIAKHFRTVYLLPSERDDGIPRAIPDNAKIVYMPWLSDYDTRRRRRALASREALDVLLWSRGNIRDLARHARRPKLYGDILAQNILKARDLANFVEREGLSDAILYDYWFENSTLAIAIVRSRGSATTAVSRAHGFDVYDAAWGGHPVPFRQAKGRKVDAVFPVSRHGADYLRQTVPALAGKLRVRHLGVLDPGCRSSPAQQAGEAPLIVSCARLIPSKRIHLIPEAVAALGRNARWVHIGDGSERSRVERSAAAALAPDSWEILGSLSNQEVLEFYEARSVQILLSLSESEGLPVSMMEAQSMGIPIVACDVGGVSEIVSPRSGALIAADADATQAGAAIGAVLDRTELTRDAIQAEFRSGYDAQSNYRGFVDDIIALRSRTSTADGSDDRLTPAI